MLTNNCDKHKFYDLKDHNHRVIFARISWLSCLSWVRLVGLRIRLSLSTLSCQRGRHGSDRTMHKLWSAIQTMITAFILCRRHSAFLYMMRNLPFNNLKQPWQILIFYWSTVPFDFLLYLGKLLAAKGVQERHCPPPSLEEFPHAQVRLVHYEGVHDQILSDEKLVWVVREKNHVLNQEHQPQPIEIFCLLLSIPCL